MKPSRSNYLGIDPGTAELGWAACTAHENGFHIDTGRIKTSSQDLLTQRLVEIRDGVSHLIQVYQPELLFIETVFTKTGSFSVKKLVAVETVLHLLAYDLKLTYHIVESSGSSKRSWRTVLNTPRHKDSKKDAPVYFEDNFGIRLNSHEADASAILIAGLINSQNLDIERIKDAISFNQCLKELPSQTTNTQASAG
jgi:Holliday junction resolvasome RuvABC endonuclease subunit